MYKMDLLVPNALVPLSSSTVAIGGEDPAEVHVWDWKQGRVLQRITGCSGAIKCLALFPDGRLVVPDWEGLMGVGTLRDWDQDTVWDHAVLEVCIAGVVLTRDGAIVTASLQDGTIKIWRDGVCESILTGGAENDDPDNLYGNSLGIVGGRLLAAGKGNTVLVFE